MSAPKHTRGQWQASLDETYAVREADGGLVAICTNLRGLHGMGGRRGGDEVAANARLIAAAPELLEALIDASLALRIGHRTTYALEKARAAIAKATGEQA